MPSIDGGAGGARARKGRAPMISSAIDEPCILQPSGPVLVDRQDGQLIEALHVRSDKHGAAAVSCRDSRGVRLRNLLVEHPEGGIGIRFERCHGLIIERVEVRVTGMVARAESEAASGHARPAQCSIKFSDCDNIYGLKSADVSIEDVRVAGGSSGIELGSCERARLRRIVARNLRGPYPRGQCVQFSVCDSSSLEDFHCVNELGHSWPEDSISVWRSRDVLVRRGLVDGNNAPNGIGVMFENDDTRASGGRVHDVDAIQCARAHSPIAHRHEHAHAAHASSPPSSRLRALSTAVSSRAG